MRADLSALDLATAQELQPDQIFVLRDVAATVLPSSIGAQGPGRGGRQLPQVDSRIQGRRGAVARLWRAAPRQVRPVTAAGYVESAGRAAAGGAGARRPIRRAADRRSPRVARCRIQGRRRSQSSRPSRRQARRRRPDGALLPQQRRQRSLLQRAHRPQHLSRDSRDHRAARAAEWRTRAEPARSCPFTNPTSASSAAASRPRC